MKNLRSCCLIVFLLIGFIGISFAQDKGQIININKNYQIAFTDLGNKVLKTGEIVRVVLGPNDFIYMQVLESSSILSKLGVSKVDNFKTNLNDFQRLAIGAMVESLNNPPTPQVNQEPAVEAKVIPTNTTTNPELSFDKLEEKLKLAKEEIRILQESNEQAKAKLGEIIAEHQAQAQAPVKEDTKSKEALIQIKAHIDNMNRILNDKE